MFVGNAVASRIKILVDICIEEPEGIPYPSVGLNEPVDNVFRYLDVVPVILVGGPKPQNLGPVLFDDLLSAMTLPRDFDIFLPVPSTTKPWVSTDS